MIIIEPRAKYTEEPRECGGLLVIGDPHLSSRRPGRRRDADWPAPVLAKLERCVEIAEQGDLVPIVLGDLFDRPVEPDERLKAQLIRVFRRFRHRPVVNVGNHDKAHTALSDCDSLALLGIADVVDVVAVSTPVARFRVAGRVLGVGMTPFGQPIPRAVTGAFPEQDTVIWFTHHDIAFEGTYPGAVPPFPIAGCAMVVNGHVHASKPPVEAGGTWWMNPGNITRQSVDLMNQAPRAWVLTGQGALRPEPLPHAPDTFDLTGRLVEPALPLPGGEALESAFVSLLKAESATELGRSADGSLLREEIEARFTREESPHAVRAIVRALLAEAVERQNA